MGKKNISKNMKATSNIYICVYISAGINDNIVYNNVACNENIVLNNYTKDFLEKLKKHDDWHYDNGDDPSFYWYEKTNILTWGVCRRNVRERLEKEDVVVFFCFCKECKSYYLSAIATVDYYIPHKHIWTKENSTFQEYFNLLINKKGEHFEPLFIGKDGHKDWEERSNSKYVIFKSDSDNTYVLKKQIKVAEWKNKNLHESWLDNDIVNTIKDFTLGLNNKKKRPLRVNNRNFAHPHIRIEVDTEKLKNWKKEFIKYLKDIDK